MLKHCFDYHHPMRTTTLLALCVALFVASTIAVSHDPLTGVFADWMQEHQKSYANEEFVYRWNVWRENYLYIEAHNHQNKSFHLAMNKFGDLTNAEFNKLFKGLSITADQPKQESDVVPAPGLPADFDWRHKGAVTHVKNQGTRLPLPLFGCYFKFVSCYGSMIRGYGSR